MWQNFLRKAVRTHSLLRACIKVKPARTEQRGKDRGTFLHTTDPIELAEEGAYMKAWHRLVPRVAWRIRHLRTRSRHSAF